MKLSCVTSTYSNAKACRHVYAYRLDHATGCHVHYAVMCAWAAWAPPLIFLYVAINQSGTLNQLS